MHSSVQNEWYVKMFDQYLNRFLTKPFQFHTFEYFIIFGNRLTGLSSPLFSARMKLSSYSLNFCSRCFEWQPRRLALTRYGCVRIKVNRRNMHDFYFQFFWTFQMLENVHCHLDFDIILIDILQAPNLRMYNLIISCYF